MRSDVCFQASRFVFRVIGIILMILTGICQAITVILVGIVGVLLKALAVILSSVAVLLCFFTSFSGWNAMIVILIATVMFWLPEAAGAFLGGLVYLQRRIMDIFMN